MNKVSVELENCYGIKELKAEFDFSNGNAYAIYAANGAMKSSLAQTFKDVVDGVPSKDRIFPNRSSNRKITNGSNTELPKETVLVIQPYDEVFGHTEKTSTLLVDSVLRKEYEKLHEDIERSKELFLKALKEQTGSKQDLEREVSLAFTKSDDEFYTALIRIKDEVLGQKDSPFASVSYDRIFDEKIVAFLNTKDFKTAIQEYIQKYNELLAASTYFKKGIFNYYNAATIAKSLADNGFFDAKHTVNLNADTKTEITNVDELEALIEKEKDNIVNDDNLKKKFAEIEKQINKNKDLREFHAYLLENEELLAELANLGKFKEKLWKSYFKVKIDLYKDLVDKYQAAETRKKEIEKTAGQQRTQWESVIEIFNNRFFVPFKLTAKNRTAVILGQEPLLQLGFTFEDGSEIASLEKGELLQALSTGEKKALYVLNIIFEVEARKKSCQETIFIIDDIADSFDYKNKYAIIEYLKEISEEPFFHQIILTHNFDFFRTVESRRIVPYNNCLMAFRTSKGLTLQKATGIKNVFVNDWKPKFFDDPKKMIASIPFMRNIIEYTKGDTDPNYIRLTSLVHWKDDSDSITQGDLAGIYNELFGGSKTPADKTKTVMKVIQEMAQECLKAPDGVNFENKITLAIAIRLAAEQYMIRKINNQSLVSKFDRNQTIQLLKEYKAMYSSELVAIDTLQRVALMTPESIHLNSFMYEPILDMSDEHLRRLLTDVQALA
jgi:energy-coupling factor transporter ATP-binding protein EcfA2